MEGPTFDVVAFAQMTENDDISANHHASSVQTNSCMGSNNAINKKQTPTQASIESSLGNAYSLSSRVNSDKAQRLLRLWDLLEDNYSDKALHDVGSQESETAYSSEFSATCTKLKDNLPRNKHGKRDVNLQRPSPKQDAILLRRELANYCHQRKSSTASVQGTTCGSPISSGRKNVRGTHTPAPGASWPNNRDEGSVSSRSTASLQIPVDRISGSETEFSVVSDLSARENNNSPKFESDNRGRVGVSRFGEGFKPSRLVSDPVSMKSMHTTEDKSSCIVTPSVYPSECNHIKVPTMHIADKESSYLSTAHVKSKFGANSSTPPRHARSNGATQVFDVPWRDKSLDGKFHGLYSGLVNDNLQPHGEGILVLEGNRFLTFYGQWVNGHLVTPLMNEDEKREQECARAHEQIECRREPSSKEYRKKSPREYKKKHSKEYRLGDVARVSRDMAIDQSEGKAIRSVSLLKNNDRAFVKRSNGLWTCAVLIDRALQPVTTGSNSRWHTKHETDRETNELEECMLFAVDEDGATKIVGKKHWGRLIRCLRKYDGDINGTCVLE